MKKMVSGILSAFSLYSAIPVPTGRWVTWDKESMKYALCFFPLVGAVTGILELLWYELCSYVSATSALYAVIATMIPVLVTGGIHMDGFMDTADAISSHAEPERKLEILKDSHIGAFGVLFCVCYLLVQFGLWQQVYKTPLLIILPALGYVVSRCMNALSIASFPCARTSGLVYMLSGSAAKRAVIAVTVILAAAMSGLALYLSPLWGGAFIAVTVLYFVYHRRFCLTGFGGNTGDLAGFLLCNLELIYLILAVAGALIEAKMA